MQLRRPLALVAAALLVCVPLLSSCGFDKATDRPYTPAEGTNYREGTVFVLGAVIAAAQQGSGTLIASFTNQSTSQTETLDSVAGAGGNTVQAGDFAPVKLPPMGFANLADTQGVALSGSFAAGDVVPLSMTFASGSTITMDVPVVYACQEYAGLDISEASASAEAPISDGAGVTMTPLASGSETPSTAPTAVSPIAPTDPSSSSSATPSGQATPSPSDTTESSSSASPSTYPCDTSGGTGGRD